MHQHELWNFAVDLMHKVLVEGLQFFFETNTSYFENRIQIVIWSPIFVCGSVFYILFLLCVLTIRKLYSTTHNFFICNNPP
jgi:hypothetical protein